MNDWSNDWIFLTIDFNIVPMVMDHLTDRIELELILTVNVNFMLTETETANGP